MAKLPDLETWAKEAGERGAQYALKYLEEEYGVSIRRLLELAQADREGRCVVLPCEAGHEISYKSGIGLRCNAVIDEYTPENIFITAKTDIPNAEPLRQTFSLSEIEAALRREQDG